MENVSTGSCLCGNNHFKIEGVFDSFYLCHCKYCQKDTGSAHAAKLFSANAIIYWTTSDENRKSFCLPASLHSIAFCTNCGSALPDLQMNGKLLVVPAGSLDSPISIKPNAHIFMSSKAPWEGDLQNIPKKELLP